MVMKEVMERKERVRGGGRDGGRERGGEGERE